MGASKIYSIPGFLGQLQVGQSSHKPTGTDPGINFGPPVPFWSYEYGGACQPRGIYLASGIPYPDVFPERQTLTAWAFSGPARNDFSPFNNTSGCFSTLGGQVFSVGQLVAAHFTLYGGAANFGPQIGGTNCALVIDFHWRGIARGQAAWNCILAAAWIYQDLGPTYDDASLFRGQGVDTSYNIPSR